ncbi:uncharacterized protein [Haliotis cracherodii]|uniref:uncharacterized protein isoform X2 n=1 Tax=Haliotis cracherodii TaxID=6455 RepID=UPI0039EC69C3
MKVAILILCLLPLALGEKRLLIDSSDVAEAQDTTCPPLRCLVPCPRGYKHDANNCLTCQCLTEQEIKANLIPLLAGKIRY